MNVDFYGARNSKKKNKNEWLCGKQLHFQYNNTTFTLWDCLEIQGPKTLREVIEWIEVSALIYY